MKRWWTLIFFVGLSISIHIPRVFAEEASTFIKHGTMGEVTYLSGGIGLEERNFLNTLAKDYNLKLVFAMASGEYLSDLMVVIQDSGGEVLLRTTSVGPWFFVRLPEGEYKVTVSVGDKKKSRQVKVDGGPKTIFFLWQP